MNTKETKKVIAVVGPTGTGKTKFALKLAQEINGELINCDSRQVYKYMDIGTNKGVIRAAGMMETFENRKFQAFNIEDSNIVGWLFDIIEPNEQLNLAEYQKFTYFIIKKIQSRGHTPILVGGTGLYLDALVKGYKLSSVKPNPELRKSLEKMSVSELFEKLSNINPQKASSLNQSDSKNPRRLMRAIEETISLSEEELKEKVTLNKDKVTKLNLFIVYPNFKREDLYKNIDERVLEMVASGLIEETKGIIDRYSLEIEALKGIGYKEVIEYLNEKITLSDMIAKIQQGHKNYAKRQITWFEGPKRSYDLTKIDFNQEDIEKDIKGLIPQL